MIDVFHGRLVILDSFMEANKNNSGVTINIENRTPAAAFQTLNQPVTKIQGRYDPRGLHIDKSDTDDSATRVYLNCRYENDSQFTKEQFLCCVDYDCEIKEIRPYNSTARGIIIKN